MSRITSLRRSLIAVPANEQRLVADAAESDADEVFFDLEDSLAPSEKDAARSTLIDAIRRHAWDETVLSYRINATDTRWWYEDVIELVTAVGAQLDTLIVPKVRSAADVTTVETLLASVETTAGLTPGSVGLCVQIETAAGMNAAVDIAHASDRLTAIAFGPADYAASIGAMGGAADYSGHYWHYPLSRVAHAAASANLLTIGGPYTAGDAEGFRAACQTERSLGYDGKIVLNPSQIEIANDVFVPDPDDARRARRIVERYRNAEPTDVIAIDGNVIDKEMYRTAERILSMAEKAGVI